MLILPDRFNRYHKQQWEELQLYPSVTFIMNLDEEIFENFDYYIIIYNS